ncbi:TolC family protein [Adhaeribacter aquaticus]|uniref:TolC family protein n=1 Tax=Adhaeribacter aquaticus TaxID=299567 RepID=UPI0003F8B8EE|nr:TolC family protein [Adhaeribacter aquaticus]
MLLSKKLWLGIALFFSIGLCESSRAQSVKTTWTLQECIDYALKNNLQIKQAELNAQLAKVNINQAKSNLLPALNGSTYYGFSFGRSINPTENIFVDKEIQVSNTSVNGNITLFNGLQLQNNIKRNRLDNEAALADIDQARNDMILNLVSAYLQILLSEELLQRANVQLASSQSQAERTQKLFRAGSVAENNVLEINAQVATDELAIINAQNQKDLAELTLIQLLDLKDIRDFEVVKPEIKDPDQDVIVFDANTVFDVAQQKMPQVKAAEIRVRSALRGIDISRGAYYPRLSLGSTLATNYSTAAKRYEVIQTPVTIISGYVNNDRSMPVYLQGMNPTQQELDYPYWDQFRNNLGRTITLNLSVPILNGFQVRNNVTRSVINHKSAVLNTEIVRNQLRRNIQQAYADATAAQKRFAATRRQLEAFQQSFRSAEIRFSNGLINPTDFNVARNNFLKAQSDLIQAKYEYTFKLKILDFYQDKPLSL